MRTTKKPLSAQPLRQEVHWVPESREVTLSSPNRPFRVWTLYGEGRNDPGTPPVLPIAPIHLRGAFLEDFLHDWNMRGTTLRYYSRVMQDNVWILVEYKNEEKRR